MVRIAGWRARWRGFASRLRTSLCVLVLLALFGPASSTAVAGWGKVSSPATAGLATPSLAVVGTQVVGAWPLDPGNNQWSAEASSFTPTTDGTALAASAKRVSIVSGWGGLGPVILLGSTSPGGVQALITGGTPTPGPLDGTDFAQRNADGSWGTPINTGLTECGTCSSAVSAIALPDGQTPMFVNNYGGSAVVFRGGTGLVAGTGTDLSIAFGAAGGLQASYPTFGRDGMGRYWLAWYNSIKPLGLAVVQIDPVDRRRGRRTGSSTGRRVASLRTCLRHQLQACLPRTRAGRVEPGAHPDVVARRPGTHDRERRRRTDRKRDRRELHRRRKALGRLVRRSGADLSRGARRRPGGRRDCSGSRHPAPQRLLPRRPHVGRHDPRRLARRRHELGLGWNLGGLGRRRPRERRHRRPGAARHRAAAGPRRQGVPHPGPVPRAEHVREAVHRKRRAAHAKRPPPVRGNAAPGRRQGDPRHAAAASRCSRASARRSASTSR